MSLNNEFDEQFHKNKLEHDEIRSLLGAVARQNDRTTNVQSSDHIVLQETSRQMKLLREEVKALRDQIAVLQNGGDALFG